MEMVEAERELYLWCCCEGKSVPFLSLVLALTGTSSRSSNVTAGGEAFCFLFPISSRRVGNEYVARSRTVPWSGSCMGKKQESADSNGDWMELYCAILPDQLALKRTRGWHPRRVRCESEE